MDGSGDCDGSLADAGNVGIRRVREQDRSVRALHDQLQSQVALQLNNNELALVSRVVQLRTTYALAKTVIGLLFRVRWDGAEERSPCSSKPVDTRC